MHLLENTVYTGREVLDKESHFPFPAGVLGGFSWKGDCSCQEELPASRLLAVVFKKPQWGLDFAQGSGKHIPCVPQGRGKGRASELERNDRPGPRERILGRLAGSTVHISVFPSGSGCVSANTDRGVRLLVMKQTWHWAAAVTGRPGMQENTLLWPV